MADGAGGSELQAAWNIGSGVLGTLVAVIAGLAKREADKLRKDLDETRRDLGELIRALPDTYARRDDLKDLGNELKATLARIEEKLDRKVDK